MIDWLWRRRRRVPLPVTERWLPRSAPEPFTPTRPQRASGLMGRQQELVRIMEAIQSDHAHVVLYAERGRGKTSLANRAAELLGHDGFAIGRYVCGSDTSFDDVMRGLARDLPASLLAVSLRGAVELKGCEAALPDRALAPNDVLALPSRLTGPYLVFIIDEFDRVENARTRNLMADTLKQVSDRGLNLCFFLIGVASSLEQLIGRHPSLQRNIIGIPLPAMAADELRAIINRGAQLSNVRFPASITNEIIDLAMGSPYVAQLLGLRLLQSAQRRNSTEVTRMDLDAAISRVAQESDVRHWPGRPFASASAADACLQEPHHACE